jgi:hypothetical protein
MMTPVVANAEKKQIANFLKNLTMTHVDVIAHH